MLDRVLVTLIAFPWAVHTLVTLSSVLGIGPLRTDGRAQILLALAGLFTAVIWRVVPGNETTPRAHETESPWAKRFVWLAIAATALSFYAALWLPTTAYDALGYRLPAIANWLDAGKISWIASDDELRNGYPLGNEAISAVICAAFHTFAFTDVTAFVFVAMGIVGAAKLAELFGASRNSVILAGCFYALVPMNLLNAPSGYVDAAFAGCVTASIALGTAWATEKRGSLLDAFAFGGALALMMATKATGSVFAVGFGGLACARAFWEDRGKLLRGLPALKLAAIPGAFWIIRNVLHTGDPFWPVDLAVGKHILAKGQGSLEQVLDVAHNLPAELHSVPGFLRPLVAWAQIHGPATSFDDRLAGLGYVWQIAFLMLIALVVKAVRVRDYRSRFLFATFCLAALFVVQPERWWPRYTMWIWSLGAPALALGVEGIAQKLDEHASARFLRLIFGVIAIETALTIVHVKGLAGVVARHQTQELFAPSLATKMHALTHLNAQFSHANIEGRVLCRTAWKPGTDNANLDGYFAQTWPRPRMVVLDDMHHTWPEIKHQALQNNCASIIVLPVSPLENAMRADATVTTSTENAFDPFLLVRLNDEREARVLLMNTNEAPTWP